MMIFSVSFTQRDDQFIYQYIVSFKILIVDIQNELKENNQLKCGVHSLIVEELKCLNSTAGSTNLYITDRKVKPYVG